MKDDFKSLTKRIEQVEEEKRVLNNQIRKLETQVDHKCKYLKQLDERLQTVKCRDLEITDHAIVRYCERVLGINVEDIKEQILTDDIRKQFKVVGNGTFPNDGFKLKIIDRRVITILT